jgi:hypothetical protein
MFLNPFSMKIIKLISFILITTCSLHAQQKTKILLVGVSHFESSSADMYTNEALDLTSPKRQLEVQIVTDKFVKFKPNQICVEFPYAKPFKLDSQYTAYLAGNYKLTSDEMDQLGMVTGKKLNLKRLTAVNKAGKFEADTVMNYATQNGQSAIIQALDSMAKEMVKEENEQLKSLSLNDFLILKNTKKSLQDNLGFYLKYMAKIGKGKDYVGSNLVADWYTTNINIYTNILRVVKPTDKAILVIFGQGHVPILKHLFENNDDFEVVEVATVLK